VTCGIDAVRDVNDNINVMSLNTLQRALATVAPLRFVARTALVTLAVSAGLGCGLTEPSGASRVAMAMQLVMPGGHSANAVAASYVDVDISGPSGPFNPPVTGRFFFDTSGTATATLDVPVGFPRILLIKIYDASNVLLFQGVDTIAVTSGPNTPTVVTVTPTTGRVPIQVTIGSYIVSVSPTGASIPVGTTKAFTATVLNPGGTPSATPARWATSNPAIVTVDSVTGVATGVLTGSTTITATALGVAAVATVTVP
jgi:hypothetical protein